MTLLNQLQGERLTTLNLLYYVPDYNDLLQQFIWQYYDRPPTFSRTHRFLNHWHDNIDAVIHSVELSYSDPITPVKYRNIKLI